MLSAVAYFRGNYFDPVRAVGLLEQLCASPNMIPDYWNTCEPIDIPFHPHCLSEVIDAIVPRSSTRISTGVFLLRKRPPAYLVSVNLRLAPVQWTTAHNSVSLEFGDGWTGGERLVAQYLCRSALPYFPDYASIPDWSRDTERYKEFRRSYTPKQFGALFSNKRPITAPFGPYGSLGDIHWFNYFGSVYVNFIGKDRLMAAGWRRVEEIGDGLACYATERIDDPDTREHRFRIAAALEEFVWTPGCSPEQKRIPSFDFSEQLSALPVQAAEAANRDERTAHLHFDGLSPESQSDLLQRLKQAGMTYDPETKTLRQTPESS